jgi:lipopolysaccharide biosynthesis protein
MRASLPRHVCAIKAMTLIRDLHKALDEGDPDRAGSIGRRILETVPRYPQSLIDYVQTLLSTRHPPQSPAPAPSETARQPSGTPKLRRQSMPPRHDVKTRRDNTVGDSAIIDEITRIAASGLFDKEWYRLKYLAETPGLADELVHYCRTGWRLGCDPSPHFSTSYYLASNPDVKGADYNPFVHYINQGLREGRACVPQDLDDLDDLTELQREIDSQYVSWHKQRLDFVPIPHTAIAFYLPQFHAIPENDAWWGKGFTEWSNVRPAKPLFPGHHQPHEPGELGYYDLSGIQAFKRQVKIAKNYLVDAFCFYFYWFNGQTLLETPIQAMRSNTGIDFKYCLCWANENWTRRWDGLDQDVLISQRHSAADDVAFIEHISTYLKDERYVRVAGKPLLIVYRPSLLPDPQATAKRWRARCVEMGIGEIHLATTHSFENVDPGTYGFDCAIEFAPNNMAPPCITESVEGLPPDFNGQIYDWRGLVSRSESYPQVDYRLYRCVNPGWDNSPRKKLSSSILLNSSPRAFQQWTVNALSDTNRHFGSDGFVFINAWNEWAEGAHLEPCQRYGYAYLESFRQARVRDGAKRQLADENRTNLDASKVAIVIHSFYPELLPEILDPLQRIPDIGRPKIIITTPYEKAGACAQQTERYRQDIHPLIIGVENRGRDILPFFTAFEYMVRAGYRVFCKLHTKRSLHRGDGKVWRRRLLGSLLDPDRVPAILERLSSSRTTGLVAPDDHLLPMSTYWGSNKYAVLGLAARLGVDARDVLALPLVAGSMFWARTEALLPLYALIDSADFESESGQTDGTMAHAIERLFSVSAYSVGLDCVDVSMKPFDPSSDLEFAFADRG